MLRYAGLYLKKQQRDSLVVRWSASPTDMERIFSSLGGKVPNLKKQIQKVCQLWQELATSLYPTMSAFKALSVINEMLDFKSQIQKGHVQKQVANDAIRVIEILAGYANAQRSSLEELIAELSNNARVERSPDGDMIQITSIHKAKGGQWPMVIIPRLEEGRFPHLDDDIEDGYHIEQERRLFYVAITRASDELNLIAPNDEYLTKWLTKGFWGFPTKRNFVASRFLYESNLLRSKEVITEFYDKGVLNRISLGEKEYMLKNYLKKVVQLS